MCLLLFIYAFEENLFSIPLGKLNSPTPFYNSIIRHDLITRENEELRRDVFSSNPKFKDAFILLKIWLRQRKLDEVSAVKSTEVLVIVCCLVIHAV